jgi:hypothetical protein
MLFVIDNFYITGHLHSNVQMSHNEEEKYLYIH